MLLRFCLFLLFFLPTGFHGRSQSYEWNGRIYKKIAVQQADMRIDTFATFPGTLEIPGIDSSTFLFEPGTSILHWKKKPVTDSVLISYQPIPLNTYTKYSHKSFSLLDSQLVSVPYYAQQNGGDKNAFLDFGAMDYNGSFGRMLSFGNNQDLVLNSQFNLQMQGDLGDSIRISGAITDNTMPFQPEGNTQQLQEFDKVFIQLERKSSKLIAGDFELVRPRGYFLNYTKKVQGVSLSTIQSRPSIGQHSIRAAASLAKGKFVRNAIPGVEGNQGPYKLSGPNGEQYFIVLAGSEKIYIDGILMKRGEEFDYTIDYNTAEIVFMPRRLITKDMRIIAEYEFSDRNYINSLFVFSEEWQVNKHFQAYTSLYSNQDAKNQPVQQSIDSSRKNFLASLGDSIQKAFYPSAIREDSFSNNKILYRKTDTLVNSVLYSGVYMYSMQKDSTLYNLSFSYVGEGMGNYIQSVSEANGRVYAWVAPVNGIRQGNYEPVLLLVTPKQQLVWNAGIVYQADSNRQLSAEGAISRFDPNSYSSIDNEKHVGLACQLHYQEKRNLSKRHQISLISQGHYEFADNRFRPVERFRTPEFNRDWNLNFNTTPADEHLGSVQFRIQKEKLGYAEALLSTFLRGNDYQGFRYNGTMQLHPRSYTIQARYDVMQHHSSDRESRFVRPDLLVERIFPKWHSWCMGGRLQAEYNPLRNKLADTLLYGSFAFESVQGYLRSGTETKNPFQFSYTYRRDYLPWKKELLRSTETGLFQLNGQIQTLKNQTIQFTASHRTLHVLNQQVSTLKPEENSTARIDYQLSLLQNLVGATFWYEGGLGQEQKREFSYVQVPAGQGQYVWRDYNHDSLKQLNEFELAIFPDEKLYIKVFTPTNQYVKAKYAQYNHSLFINPSVLIKDKKNFIQQFLGALYFQSALQIQNRSLSLPGFEQYNPFRIKSDSNLLFSNLNLTNTLSLNRFHPKWGIDLQQVSNTGKVFMNYGIDTRGQKEYILKYRLNTTHAVSTTLSVKSGERSFYSSFLENRSYVIRYMQLEPLLNWMTYKNRFRIQLGYRYDDRKNSTIYGNETAFAHYLLNELRYNLPSAGLIQMRFTYANIKFRGEPNSGVGYALLDGLSPGSNWLWQVSFNRRLSKLVEMSLEYEGRKSGSQSLIHTGRATVRAVF